MYRYIYSFPSISEDSGGGGGGESFYGNGWLVKGEGQDRNNKFANRVRSIETFFLYNLGHFKLFNWIYIAKLSDFCRTFSRNSCRIQEYFRLTKQHLSNWWKIFPRVWLILFLLFILGWRWFELFSIITLKIYQNRSEIYGEHHK